MAGLQDNQLTWDALRPPRAFAVRWVSASALLCKRLSPPCRMLSSAQHVSTGSPWGQRSKRSNLLFFPPLPESCARDLPPPNQLCNRDTTYELQAWVRMAVGRGNTFCSAPGTGRKQSWRQRGKPRAAGSRRWGPAGCSACRNARLLEPRPQGCSTGPAPAGESLGKTRQG